MIHAPEWIPAWRLKQAYLLTEADILSLVQSLGEQAHISFHSAWGMLQEYFLKHQIETMPEHWRSTLDGVFDDPRVNSPLWIVRAFNERDRLYASLRIVAAQTDSGKFCDAVTTLFETIYEGEPSSMSVNVFCAPFITPNSEESSRFFSQIFHESLLFNKYAAVEALEKAHYPLVAEVKGITKDFVKTVRSTIPQSTSDAIITTPPGRLAQGGSRPEIDKCNATKDACANIIAAIRAGQYLDRSRAIGRDEFAGLVKDSMEAHGERQKYQITTARNIFASSQELIPFRRPRGRKKDVNSIC
jgi:hypothetical protein